MSYVRKMLAQDEQMIGVARLHWIYIAKGVAWFFALALLGWVFNAAMSHVVVALGNTFNSDRFTSLLVNINSNVMFFMMACGLLIFGLFVVQVLTTEIGLSERRIMHKKGLIFVKVHQIDIEEIRGENLDLGYLGRILGYGYIMLDCRFIGDIKLPAIERPERFLRALHAARADSQDTLSVMLGKGNRRAGIDVVDAEGSQQPHTPKPEIQPGQPGTQPEVEPDRTPQPEIQPEPTPHAPNPPPAPPTTPDRPAPPPSQPTPPPGPNPQPPLQPPSETTAASVDPKVVAQVVQQVLPQMAQQVAQQLKDQGLVEKQESNPHNDVDNDLITVFDEARFKDKDPHDLHDKLEHVIH